MSSHARRILCPRVGQSIIRRLFVLIRFVMPGQSPLDLLKVGINPTHPNLTDNPAIPISLIGFDAHVPVKHLF